VSSLTESEYIAAADRELSRLIDALDELQADFEGVLDAELSNGIVTITLPGGPPFVLNSHRAARQLWLAADRTAWHFDYLKDEERWVAQKTSEELWTTLESALSGRLGRQISLQRAG